MRVLWIVNSILPYPAEKLGVEKNAYGGWINGLAENLRNEKNLNFAIATTYFGNDVKRFSDGKITYYLIPGAPVFKYNKEIDRYCKLIVDEFEPDILHIHGSEFAHGLSFLNVCNDKVKKIISIQGLTSRIGQVYLSGISHKEIVKTITIRDILRRDNMFQQKKKFIKRGTFEKEMISKCDYIIGRTDWDKYNSKAINHNAEYYSLQETVREAFYKNEWNIDKIERNSIYLSQGSYPIKGLHILLEAINIVKKEYPEVKLYVSGSNIIKKESLIDGIKLSGYGKYLNKLIKKYNLEKNIVFTGVLDEEAVIERLLRTHVVVIPSVIENESNSLTEAHLLGVPTIAAFSGGMTDRIIHKETGFLYPFSEVAMCAGYIIEYFKNDSISIEFGKKARERALVRNNAKDNQKKIIELYSKIERKKND